MCRPHSAPEKNRKKCEGLMCDFVQGPKDKLMFAVFKLSLMRGQQKYKINNKILNLHLRTKQANRSGCRNFWGKKRRSLLQFNSY